MGKSSSSSKKIKHSRDSSKLRSVKKKKTKRSKSKKIRRLKDYTDANDSLYSTSEDDYRRKKKKKRPRKRYSSSESDDSDSDSDDTRLLRIKKKSKRNEELVERKKKKKKKKKFGSRKRRKRDSSSSFTSSNQSDDGSESDAEKSTRRLGKVRAAEEDSESDEGFMNQKKNSRRLKSIVVVSYTYDNDEKKILDDERYCEASISYPTTGADENGCKSVGYKEFEEDNKSETSKSSRPVNSLKDDDLEAILKRRALENLKRFRGETQKSGIASKEVSSEPLQAEFKKPHESQDLCVSAGSKDLLQVVNVKESGTVVANVASQNGEVKVSSCTTKRKLIRPVLGQENIHMASRKEDSGCQAETINGSTFNKNCPESSATKNRVENIETLEKNNGGSESEEKMMDETKDESQYEQKTMTVMRGGEMVQVSYKVYIPKKTSSLGRRQLKR